MSKIYFDSVHAQNVLQRMWEQTECKEFCDVALIAGDTEEIQISAHRSVLSASSEYFKTMFTPPINESTAWEVKLPDVDGESLKSLVKFCYTGRLEMRADTAEKLLVTADSLLLDNAVNACGNCLAEQLHPTNCLGMAQLAERHHCESLSKQAKDFCLKYYVELYKSDEFLKLSAEQLTQLLGNDDLRDSTEEHVFKSLMIWLEHDRTERDQHKDEMLKLVRLRMMKPSLLIELVKPVCESVASFKLYTEATDWYLMPKRRTVYSSELTKPRRSYERLMALKVENNKLNILYHCPQRIKWMKCQESLQFRKGFGVAELKDDLFIVGGEAGGTRLNTVICLNLKTMTLKNVNPMSVHRTALGVAVEKGYLYAVGGWNNKHISSVEKWDPYSNTWKIVSSMSVSRHAFGITVFNGKIYVAGGCTGNKNTALSITEYYNPEENKWTSIASMREARIWPWLAVANGMLYAVCGNGSSTIERYNQTTDKWSTFCITNVTVGPMFRTVFFEKMIAFTGDCFMEYNTKTKEWNMIKSFTVLLNTENIFSFSGSILESKFVEN